TGTWSISQSRHLNVGHGSSSPSPSNATSSSTTTSGSSSRQRRKSGDDILHQQQASSPSRKPATILDAFRPRSKSDASRTKKPTSAGSTIISQMKSAMQHSLNMSSSPSSKSTSSDSSSHHNHLDSSSSHPTGRPRAGSESSGRGPVSKVMDMFRHRSHSAVSAEDKRKAVSVKLTKLTCMLKPSLINNFVINSLAFKPTIQFSHLPPFDKCSILRFCDRSQDVN
ncbi:hypothetical protein C0J52_18286, partial [Blattella germanica]